MDVVRMRGAWSLVFVLVLSSIGCLGASAQDEADPEVELAGAITGTVVEAGTGDPLPGANVRIKGTSTGTTTDLKGRYRLDGLDPGTYGVVYSFVGFQQKTVTGVEVEAGKPTAIEVTLAEETAQLDEVVISAEAARDTEAGLLKDRAEAAAVSDAISAETMNLSGAGTAAAAMEKVTGASVIEGKYVNVRGLGGRYASTQLNGVDLPSSDPGSNSVQFDLFPTDLLDNIRTLKTFTPDRPGDFGGGLVDITTKSFPEQFTFSISSSVTHNTQVQGNGQFLTHPGGSFDWLGFDDGTRAAPSILAQTSAENIPDRPIFAEDPERYSRLSKSLSGPMGPSAGTAPVNQSYSVSLGNQSDVFGRPLGYVFSLSYDREASFYEDGETGRYQLGGNADELSELIFLTDQKATEEASIGGIANLTYRLSENHEVGLNSLYTHVGQSTTRFQEGQWTAEAGPDDVLTNRTLLFKERDVRSVQLRGENYLEELGRTRITWNGAFSKTTQEEPDRRFFASIARVQASGDTLYSAFDQGLRPPSRIFRDLAEEKYSGTVDVQIPLSLFDRKGHLKFGGSYGATARNFSERQFSFNSPDPASGIAFDGNASAYFREENRGVVGQDETGNPVFGLTIDDQTSAFNSYDGERAVGAGYAMAEVPLWNRLKVIGGVRLESTDLSVQATPDSSGQIDETDLLPSLNIVYELRDDMNLRLAGTRTLARPTFREVAPYPGFDFIQGEVIIGNPSLTRTLITNVDLRWEWFTGPGEILAASVYYKTMEDPIERAFIGSSSNTGSQLTWRNVDQATIYGAEFEARTRLGVITPALRNVKVGGNLSLTQSEIDVPCFEYADDGSRCLRGPLVFRQVNDESSTRNLQGQSPYLLNLDLRYENPETGTSAGIFYSVFGERLSVVSTGSTPDVFTQPRPQLDVTFSQRLFSRWTASFKAKNLLNSAQEKVYSFGGESFPYQKNETGRSFSLGFKYQIN